MSRFKEAFEASEQPTTKSEVRLLTPEGIVSWTVVNCQCSWTAKQEEILSVLGGEDPTGGVWNYSGQVLPVQRRLVALLCGRGSGKTEIAAAYAVWRAFTADLSSAGGGDVPIIAIVAPSDRQAQIALRRVIDMVQRGALKDYIRSEKNEGSRDKHAITADTVRILRPDGRPVWIMSVAKSPNGRTLRGYSVVALIIDEAEQFETADDRLATDQAHVDAVSPRLMKDGSIILISTPFNNNSLMARHIKENYGHPVNGLACIATTRDMRPDDDNLLTWVAQELERNPRNAMREYECIRTALPGSYFNIEDIEACTIDAARITRNCPTAAVDLGFISDSSGGLGLERQDGVLVQTWEFLASPKPGQMLMPSHIRQQLGDLTLAGGAELCAADVHEYASLCEDFLPRNITVVRAPTGEKLWTAFGILRDLLRSRLIRVLPKTAEQLKNVKTEESGKASVKHSADGHGDLVSALVAAVWCDRRFGMLSGGGGTESPRSFRGSWTH